MKKIIILLGLLIIPSFSFAINELNPVGIGQNIGGDSSNFCLISSNLSFECSATNNVIASYTNHGNANVGSSFRWRDDGLGFYYKAGGRGTIQGVITGFTFCHGNYVDSDSFNQYRNGCTDIFTYDQFKQYVSSHELKKWGWATFYNSRGNGGPVFVFDEGAFRFSFELGDYWKSLYYGTYGIQDFGLSGNPLNIDYSNVGVISSPNTNNNTTTPPTQYACPTIQQLIDTYPEQYNTGLCYSSNLIYSGGTIQTITPKTIFELYPTRKELNQDVQNYNTYCNNVATQQACQTIFEGKNEEYTLIAKIPQNVMPMQLYAYCNLTLNLDPNSTTCTVSTGGINNGIGIDDIIDNIGKTPITVITPGTPPEDEGNGTGSVFDKYTQEEDETKRRNIIQKAEDTIETMKEIYTKLTGIFRARQGKNGIVPPLITGLIALIILYKLFKK